MRLRFIDYLKYCVAHDLRFDCCIGDIEMPHTYEFLSNMTFTKYCMDKYGDLLNSMCEVKYDPRGRHTDVVIVDYHDSKKGEQFTHAVAGYILDSEYQKLFNC